MTWEPKPRGHKAVAVQTSWAGAFLREGTAGTGRGGRGDGDWGAPGHSRAGAKQAAAGGRPVTWPLERRWVERVLGSRGRLQQRTDVSRLTAVTDVHSGARAVPGEEGTMGRLGKGGLGTNQGLPVHGMWVVRKSKTHARFPRFLPISGNILQILPKRVPPWLLHPLVLQISDCWGARGLMHRGLSPRDSSNLPASVQLITGPMFPKLEPAAAPSP